VGPIGSGKSEFAERLVRSLRHQGKRCKHIDGDNVCDFTERLGAERGETTLMNIHDCCVCGLVPVVSTGGGVLATVENLLGKLEQIFQTPFRLVVVVVGRMTELQCIERVDPTFDPTSIYEKYSLEFYMELVKTRGWDANPLDVMNGSVGNAKFAKTLLTMAEHAFVAPQLFYRIRRARVGQQGRVDTGDRQVGSISGFFKQKRVVVLLCDNDKAKAKHVTISFNPDGDEVDQKKISGLFEMVWDVLAPIGETFQPNSASSPGTLVTDAEENDCGGKGRPSSLARLYMFNPFTLFY